MTLLLLNFKCFEDYKNSYKWEYINGLCMQDRFSFILCMVTLSSFSSTTNASSPLYDVMNYGAVGDGKTDDSQVTIAFSVMVLRIQLEEDGN